MADHSFLPGAGERGLVSVIIPTYNRAALVGAAIESVLASTYSNVEAIVIDDGSTDDTRDVIAIYTDVRLRYLHQANGGMSAARNHGLNESRGEYIAFLDSDDEWLPWKLAAQIELFDRHPEVGLVWTDMSAIDAAGGVQAERYLRTYYHVYQQIEIERVLARGGALADLTADAPGEWRDAPYYTGDVFREMFLGSLVHPSTAVLRRERVRRAGAFDFSLTGPGAEDYHFYYRVSELGPVALIDAPSTRYRIGDPLALSNSGLAQARGNLNVLSHWMHHDTPPLPAEVVRRRITGAHEWLGREELSDGDPRRARAHLWKAFRLQPSARIAIRLLMTWVPRGALQTARKLKHAILRDRPGH